jgi:hypothetical protein
VASKIIIPLWGQVELVRFVILVGSVSNLILVLLEGFIFLVLGFSASVYVFIILNFPSSFLSYQQALHRMEDSLLFLLHWQLLLNNFKQKAK